MQQFSINEADLLAFSRARQALLGSMDAKRPAAWDQFGYTTDLSFEMLHTAYKRGGPGHGAVHRILDKCWQKAPRIKSPASDDETPWEVKTRKVLEAVQGWKKLRDFDRRNMVGKYAGLILRVADNGKLSDPMVKAQKLVDLVPVYENQLRVQGWDSNADSPTFGSVTMWQYRFRAPMVSNQQAAPDKWVDVHPSRIIILAEGSVGDFQDGVPLLETGFNHLVDLEKIGGGSAESYLKNSARTMVFTFDTNSNPQAITQNPDGSASGKSVATVLEEKTQALNSNIDASIALQGGEASTLQTTMHDPEGAFMIAANLFAASVQIPFTVLFGQQTGRMASDEDKADMAARCQSRQATELTPMLIDLVTRLQAAGIVDAGEFEIEWEDLAGATDEQKVDRLVKMTTAMTNAFNAGLPEPLFDAAQLRGVVDFEEPEDLTMLTEGEPDDGEGDDDPAPGQAAKPEPQRPTGNAGSAGGIATATGVTAEALLGALRESMNRPVHVNIGKDAIQVNTPPAEVHFHQGDTTITAHLPKRGPVEKTVTKRDSDGLIVKTVEREIT